MITSRQIRAARGLLGWDAVVLAQRAGVTKEAISRIESGKVRPHESTMAKIQRAFNDAGVEFTPNSGVQLKPQGVDVLTGHDGICQFFDIVYEHLRAHGGPILQTGVDEEVFSKYLGDYSAPHIARMTTLVNERKDIHFRALIREGDKNFACSEYAEYRWLPSELFEPVPFYVFGDSLAIISFQTIPAPTIVLHNIKAITDSYRKQFELLWKMSKKPE